VAKFQDLIAQNPQLQQQYQQWKQQQQSQNSGQTGNQGQGQSQGQGQQNQGQGRANRPDWPAFRKYLKEQGQPDPGEEPEDLEATHKSM
jgi:hypothetical protein